MHQSEVARKFNKVNIEISNICNLQCSFCPEVIRTKKLMEPNLFRHIIKEVAPLTEQVCFHLMGDPLVHPKLSEFIEICHEYNVKIFLVTNGVLLREKEAKLLLHPAFRQVNFSLHSFADNFGDRCPAQYLENIFAYTEQAFTRRPELYINYRLWNLDSHKGVTGKHQDMLLKIEDRFEVKINPNIDVRIHKGQRLKNRLYLHFDTEFIWPDTKLPLLGTTGTCHALSTHFGILVDGTVVPCCLDKEGIISLGNIQENSILQILNSTRSQAILEGFRKKFLIEELCQHCQYIERFKKGAKDASTVGEHYKPLTPQPQNELRQI